MVWYVIKHSIRDVTILIVLLLINIIMPACFNTFYMSVIMTNQDFNWNLWLAGTVFTVPG